MTVKICVFATIMLTAISTTIAQKSNPNYDSLLAKKLEADDYGMKNYVFVMLKTGTNRSTDKEFRSKCFKSHFDNIGNLIESKKMIVAGPYETNEYQYRGIFILDVPTIEEANELLKNDLTITEGIFEAQLIKWYGPAALPTYLATSDKIWKVQP